MELTKMLILSAYFTHPGLKKWIFNNVKPGKKLDLPQVLARTISLLARQSALAQSKQQPGEDAQ